MKVYLGASLAFAGAGGSLSLTSRIEPELLDEELLKIPPELPSDDFDFDDEDELEVAAADELSTFAEEEQEKNETIPATAKSTQIFFAIFIEISFVTIKTNLMIFFKT